MSNPAFKPSEGKREEFRKYLEKNGIMDALTKVLVNLYEETEKPEDALEYIRDKLALQSGLETFSQMKATQEELQNKISDLSSELEALKAAAENQEVPVEDGLQDEQPAETVADEEAPPAEPEPEAEAASEPAPAENVE